VGEEVTAPVLLLMCTLCGWRPSQDEEIAAVQQHYEDDHDGLPVAMNLTAYCPKDDVPLVHRMTGVVRASGQNATTYDCPACQRTYHVKWSPSNL
jgi:hypothetical protein